MTGASRDRLAAPGGRGLAEWQAGKRAHGKIGEGLGFEAVSVPADLFRQSHLRGESVSQGGDEVPVVAAAAADDPQHRVLRHETAGALHGLGREVNERGGTVRRRQTSKVDGDRVTVQ